MLALKILLGLVLLGLTAFSGLFGYICLRAKAFRWGTGFLAAFAACIALFYWIVFVWGS